MDVLTNITDEDVNVLTFGNSSQCPTMTDGDRNLSAMSVIAGSVVAMVAQILSGISIAIRKKALTALSLSGARPARDGGLGYLRLKLWWLGFILLVVTQTAYGISITFTSALVAAPVAVLNIAGSAIGGRLILKDRIGPFGWLGCLMLTCSCAIFAVSAPEEIDLATVEEVNNLYTSTSFIVYVTVIVIVDVILVILACKYDYKHLLILCFLVGSSASLGIWLVKGVGAYFSEGAFLKWPLWIILGCQALTMLFNVYFSNLSNDIFIVAHSAATRYVIFSSLVIACSALLFPIKMNISIKEGILLSISFITIISSLLLLNVGKYVEFDFKILIEGRYKAEEHNPVAVISRTESSYNSTGVRSV